MWRVVVWARAWTTIPSRPTVFLWSSELRNKQWEINTLPFRFLHSFFLTFSVDFPSRISSPSEKPIEKEKRPSHQIGRPWRMLQQVSGGEEGGERTKISGELLPNFEQEEFFDFWLLDKIYLYLTVFEKVKTRILQKKTYARMSRWWMLDCGWPGQSWLGNEGKSRNFDFFSNFLV